MRFIITTVFGLLLVSLASSAWEITVEIEENFHKEDKATTATLTLLNKQLKDVDKGMYSSIVFAQDRLNKVVAIKYVYLNGDPKDPNRKKTWEEIYLKNEFKAIQTLLKRLEGQELLGIPEMYHLGMANVIEGSSKKYLAIVMKYFPQTLNRFRNLDVPLQKHKPMTDEDIVKYTIQILKILKLYQLGNMVHRDLKPDNIMVDRNGNLCIIDLGFAHYDGNYIPKKPNGFPPRLGALLYQHLNDLVVDKDPDTKSDLYAVVVMMAEFEMGNVALEADVRLKGKSADPGNEAKYFSRLGNEWWLPYSKSRFDETLMFAYLKRPKELQDFAMILYNDVMSTKAIDYDTYLKTLAALFEKIQEDLRSNLRQETLTEQKTFTETPPKKIEKRRHCFSVFS